MLDLVVRGIDLSVNLPSFLPFSGHRMGMGPMGYFWSKTIGTNRLAGQNVSEGHSIYGKHAKPDAL
jgi:hypothetical protein